jgi:hypothetical protein
MVAKNRGIRLCNHQLRAARPLRHLELHQNLTKQGISSNLSACQNETGTLELEGAGLFAVVNPQKTNLVWTLAQIGAIWIASDIGFYYLLPTLGVSFNFDRSPVAAAIYYAFWVGITLITFWPMYRSWSQFGRLATFESRLASCIIWSLTFTACIFFAAYVLPLLPKIVGTQSVDSQEFKMATSVFFLPKSIEIFFQQLLFVAMALTLSFQQLSLRKMSICCALMFGGAHFLLAFDGVPLSYITMFMTSAAVFGFVFPYLILRVPNGFAYSFTIHWLYYAAIAVMTHLFRASSST